MIITAAFLPPIQILGVIGGFEPAVISSGVVTCVFVSFNLNPAEGWSSRNISFRADDKPVLNKEKIPMIAGF